MNVLMISGDPKILSPESVVYKRTLMCVGDTIRLVVFVHRPRAQGGQATTALGQGYIQGFEHSKISAAFAMLRAAFSERFTVVTAQDPFFLGLIGWCVARSRGARLQLQVHTDLFAPEFVVRNRAKVLLARFLLRRADMVRVVSKRVADSLVPLKLRANISILPVYIDVDAVRKAPVPNRSDFSQFDKLILVASRLEKEKNVEASLHVMKEVLVQVPGAGLLIAGDGTNLRNLRTLARELGIEKNVLFLGYRPDIFSLYKVADVNLVTSWYEGYGASMVEALLAGCPVVSPDIGVAREVGAHIAERSALAGEVVQVLQSATRATPRLDLLSEAEYGTNWRTALEYHE